MSAGSATSATSSSASLSSSLYTPETYRALKTEQGVFMTPPYSTEIKEHWRFKDEAEAKRSSEIIWQMFQDYRQKEDFIGMDIARKFLQMGRTRSLRYALRKGGKKYEIPSIGHYSHTGQKEIPRTGEVYDDGKLKGAQIYEGYWKRCWDDATYVEAFDDWKKANDKAKKAGKFMGGVVEREAEKRLAKFGKGKKRSRTEHRSDEEEGDELDADGPADSAAELSNQEMRGVASRTRSSKRAKLDE